MTILTGNDMPTLYKTYYIHKYPVPKGVDVSAVSVLDDFDPAPGGVRMEVWESHRLQKFLCVEYGGYLGFICRASPAHDVGAYLGYNDENELVCTALYQREHEHHIITPAADGGFNWFMKTGNKEAYVGISGFGLKLYPNFELHWGFTEAKE